MGHLFDTPDTHVRVKDYSAAGVRRSIEDSLVRLGVDRIDIALVHDPDLPQEQHDTLTQALPELARMRAEGLIGAVGVGMNEWQAPLQFVTESEPGTVDVIMLAGRWTLLDRTGAPLLEACLERGVSVLAAAPFNSGLLAKPRPDAASHFDYRAPSEVVLRAANDLADAAEAADATLPQTAIQFPLQHPAVASVVTGIAKPEHARTSTGWLTQPVAADFWPRADSIAEGIL
jgi:D-threo-aldose 1-dehydrogenase